VGKERILLKDHAYMALLWREVEAWARYHFARNFNFACIQPLESSD
jgi:hypothetical protein